MTRAELIAALEAAKGPSDDLDLATAEWCYQNGGIAGVNYDPQLWVWRRGGNFTSIIDAALTLVPEGYQAVIWTAGAADVFASTPGVHVYDPTQAATPAIALCAAALKARNET